MRAINYLDKKLVGLPIALAMILQMLTASLFYHYLNRQALKQAVVWTTS